MGLKYWIWIKKNRVYLSLVAGALAASLRAYRADMTSRVVIERELHQRAVMDSVLAEKRYTKNTLKTVLYNIAAANAEFDDVRLPIWYKVYDKAGDRFKMVYINKEYERVFNVDRIEYLGNLDRLVHGTELAEQYEKLDRMAFKSREPVYGIEPSGLKNNTRVEVVKWRVDKGDQIFVFGAVIKYLK